MTLERGTLLYNRYRIVEILGQGGMGSVYRAIDENLGVDVAVKENLFTTEEYARQFRLEAIILANLRHPNLPRVTDHFVIEDQGQYLVMDYIEGEDLRQRMERLGTLPEEDVILIGAAMCDALAYLHSRKPPILHRDIKPGNVKITPEGNIFLVDFGLAKVVQGSQATTTGARAMTPGYSPPEQYGTARTDPRSDIYSLGATLYAALTGVIPEDGLARAMDNAQLTPVRKRNPNVSRRLAAAIEKAMAVDPDDRFQTAEEFKKALLRSTARTRRLTSSDYTVSPPPEEPEIETGEGKEGAAEQPSPMPIAPPPPSNGNNKRKKKKRKDRGPGCWLSSILIITVVAILAYFSPATLTAMMPQSVAAWFSPPTPTATVTPTRAPLNTPTATGAEVAPTISPTNTPTPPPPIPTATFTPRPTDTPTPTETPLGGGWGQIAFASDRSGVLQIYLANTDGSNVRPLTNLPDGACQPDWAPDGTRLVFVSPCALYEDRFKGASLFMINADGSGLTQLSTAPGGDFEPAWSPDGRRIVFTSLRDGYRQIYLMDIVENTVTRLTNTGRDAEASQPAWSPFGNQIVYTVQRYGAYQIWTMTDTGQAPAQLVRSGTELWDFLPAWSPDGETILFSQRRAASPIYLSWLMSIRYQERGSTGTRLNASPLPIVDVEFSPDGFWIAFEGQEEDNPDIYIMTVTGAVRTRVTFDPGADIDPAWRPLPMP